MKETPSRRITVTSSLNEICTDQRWILDKIMAPGINSYALIPQQEFIQPCNCFLAGIDSSYMIISKRYTKKERGQMYKMKILFQLLKLRLRRQWATLFPTLFLLRSTRFLLEK